MPKLSLWRHAVWTLRPSQVLLAEERGWVVPPQPEAVCRGGRAAAGAQSEICREGNMLLIQLRCEAHSLEGEGKEGQRLE